MQSGVPGTRDMEIANGALSVLPNATLLKIAYFQIVLPNAALLQIAFPTF
jgi:hypothetical protein